MDKLIYALGAGGHAQVIIDALHSNGIKVFGIIDVATSVGMTVLGVPVLGNDEFLAQLESSTISLVNGVGANPDLSNRRNLFGRMKQNGFEFMTVQHTSSVIGQQCQMNEGVQIMAGVILQNSVWVGQNALINTRVSIDHCCVIGPHTVISPGAVLCGDVVIGSSVFIGAGAVLLPGVKIGENAIIGAGAIVTSDVVAGATMVGNPAKIIRMSRDGKLEACDSLS